MLKKNLKFIIPALILFLILLVYFISINYTTIYVDKNYAEEGYLPLNDLILLNEKNNKVGLFPSDGEHDYLSNYHESEFHTYKALKVGDKFEDFIEKYGDYYCNNISAIYYDYERNSSSYNSEVYNSMKVKDFYDQYIKTGEIDINKYEISFDFDAYVYGNKVGFSENQRSRIDNARYDSFWPKGGIFNPRLQRYNLSFDFAMIDGEYVLEYLSSYHYAY